MSLRKGFAQIMFGCWLLLICCSNVDSCFFSDALFFDFVVLFLVILFIVHRRLCQSIDDHFFRFVILVETCLILSCGSGLQLHSVSHAEFCFREISDAPCFNSGGHCGVPNNPLNPDFHPCPLSIFNLEISSHFWFSQFLIGVFSLWNLFGLFWFSLLSEIGAKLQSNCWFISTNFESFLAFFASDRIACLKLFRTISHSIN